MAEFAILTNPLGFRMLVFSLLTLQTMHGGSGELPHKMTENVFIIANNELVAIQWIPGYSNKFIKEGSRQEQTLKKYQ